MPRNTENGVDRIKIISEIRGHTRAAQFDTIKKIKGVNKLRLTPRELTSLLREAVEDGYERGKRSSAVDTQSREQQAITALKKHELEVIEKVITAGAQVVDGMSHAFLHYRRL